MWSVFCPNSEILENVEQNLVLSGYLSFARPLLFVPLHKTTGTFPGQVFHCTAPTIWNSLLNIVTAADSLISFKSRLNTHLFNQTFKPTCPQSPSDSDYYYYYYYYYYFYTLERCQGCVRNWIWNRNGVTLNPGSEQKQNCRATKLKCAETKSCLRGHPLNELWSCDRGRQETYYYYYLIIFPQ